MKKTLTFLFALIMISNLSFAIGRLFVWTGTVNSDWQNPGNWTLPIAYPEVSPMGASSTWPGQFDTEDYAQFSDGLAWVITNVPTCTLARLEILPNGISPTETTLVGTTDCVILTFIHSFVINLWNVKIESNCTLACNTPYQRVNIEMSNGTNFWQKGAIGSQSFFYPAQYNNCTGCKGFVLHSGPLGHAEYIQQLAVNQSIKGWQEFYLPVYTYNYISLPIKTEVPPMGEYLTDPCRSANTLCVFDGDFLRKFSNGVGWDNWIGSCNLFFPPVGNPNEIEIGRGYEFYGSLSVSQVHELYGTFNSGIVSGGTTGITLPITTLGWNFVGNPFASAITFGEPSGAPTAGQGWTWNHLYTDPVAYWWDNSVTPGGAYRYYNWYTGDPQPSPPNLPGVDPKVIAKGQAFFVHVSILGPQSNVTVSNDARVFRNSYLVGKSGVTNKLNLSLLDNTGNFIDNAYVTFREDATTTNFDPLLDAYKLFNEKNTPSQIYGKTTDDIAVVQKSLKLASGNILYPLYMKVTSTGTYSLDASTVNTFSPNTGILLTDTKTNTTVDLKANPVYTFTANEGDDYARFNLRFSDVVYGLENLYANTIKIYSSEKTILIRNYDLKTANGSVMVYDMVGKLMLKEDLNYGEITRINTLLCQGFYIVSVLTEKGVYNQKVYIK